MGGAIDDQLVVSGGLVYISSSDGILSVFPESCSSHDCAPIAVLAVGALPPAPAIWSDRVVYAVSADGLLTAYTVDGAKI